MRLLYKKVLDKMRESSFLNENLYLEDGDLIDNFFAKEIFSLPEKEDINRYNRGKIECIVEMLKVKTDSAYKAFKECLTKNYKHVVDQMWRLEVESEHSCEDCLKFIQQLLQNKYSLEHESSVSFDDIQSTILQSVRASPKHHDTLLGVLDESFFKECITQAFSSAKIETEIVERASKTKNKKKKKKNAFERLVVSGIVKKQRPRQSKPETASSISDSSDESESGDDSEAKDDAPKSHFDVDEFSCLIKAILDINIKDWDLSIPDKIKEQKVDSEIYELMSEDEKVQLFPRIGERIRIKTEWEKIKTGTSTLKLNITKSTEVKAGTWERLRRFDHPVSTETKYMQGSKVKPPTRPGNLLTPVHKYVCDNDINSVLRALINFASACMNDRINGTFHAGISESYEVVGCKLEINTIDAQITKAIRGRFKDYQVTIALKCIRPPQFIDVILNKAKGETLHVVEVDVIPHHRIIENHTFFVKGKQKDVFDFYRYQGDVIQQDHSAIDDYMQQERNILIQQRIEVEGKRFRGKTENLNKRLKDFLCCGNDELEESLYPVIVLSHLGHRNKNKFRDGEFCKDIPWRAVFDFNEKDDDNGFQNMLEERHAKRFLTLTVEDFNQRKRDDRSLRQTRDKITESSLPAWIYSSGFDTNESQVDARIWMHNTGESFRKALEFYSSDIIPDNRGRIIVPLFNKENKILTEAIVEILLQFGKQCLIVCPSRSVASICYEELSKRPNAFPPKCTIDDFFLVGLPWEQVNDCVRGILKSPKHYDGIEIPRSTGVPFTIAEKLVNELSDLEIVGINECQDIEKLNEDEKHLKVQEVREEYYQGGSIQWYNFYFRNQVLVRDVNRELADHVRGALEGNDNEGLAVEKVAVYHQPGSGGSTTSKQIMWDMKSNYRCCVVKKITSQTCDQIGRFRFVGENDDEDNDIKPVLVLLDNNNEDVISQFVDDLENESEKHNCDLFCVLLICFRVSALPLDTPSKYVMLRQELSQGGKGEHNWFKENYKILLEHHKKQRGCHPRTLIGFNIMKENFDMESIKKSVREFVGDRSISSKQMTLLKYLSFFNSFDLHFQSVPISCFDSMMKPPLQWIKQFPPSFKVLVSECRRRQGYGGNIIAIRMSNYLLSRPVLDAVLEIEREHEGIQSTVGEVALDVMNSDCFSTAVNKYENKLLRCILGDIMKKRDRSSSNKGKLNKFSPLIKELLGKNDSDQAKRIVSMTYDITDDSLVAQQLARLNAELENWEEGHEAIDKAIEQKPYNSYLRHTKGQIYKEQLQIVFSAVLKGKESFPSSQLNTAISLTCKAIECYRKSQELSETPDLSQQNPAGYESEILMVIELLRLLGECRELRPLNSVFKGTLMKEDLINAKNHSFLTGLPDMVNVTVEKLERFLHGTNRRLFHSGTRSVYSVDKKQLDKHRQELARFFYHGMTCNNENTGEKIDRLNVWSFLSAIRFTDLQLMLKQLQFMDRTNADLRHQNLRIFLAMYMSLSLTAPASLPVEPSRILSLSRKYLDTIATKRSELAILESYLYFTSLHWPLPTRKKLEDKISPNSKWSEALSDWLALGNKQSSKQRRNDKIFYYLGNRASYPGFVKIDGMDSIPYLAKFTGVVNENGTDVNVSIHSFQSDKGPSIKIPFYRKLGRNILYNRKVEIIIGFGLQGPRADWLEKPSSFRLQTKSSTNNFQGQRKRLHNIPSLQVHDSHNWDIKQGKNIHNADDRYATAASYSSLTHQQLPKASSGCQTLECRPFQNVDSYPSLSSISNKSPQICFQDTYTTSDTGDEFSCQNTTDMWNTERRPCPSNNQGSHQFTNISSRHGGSASYVRQAPPFPPGLGSYEQTHARLANQNQRPMYRGQRPSMYRDQRPSMYRGQRPSMYRGERPSMYRDQRTSMSQRPTMHYSQRHVLAPYPSPSNINPPETRFQSQSPYFQNPFTYQQNIDRNDEQHVFLPLYAQRRN